MRRECLDSLLILSPRHLQEVLRVYVTHYNTQRPHRGLGLCSPVPAPAPFPVTGSVGRRDLLGGVIHDIPGSPPNAPHPNTGCIDRQNRSARPPSPTFFLAFPPTYI